MQGTDIDNLFYVKLKGNRYNPQCSCLEGAQRNRYSFAHSFPLNHPVIPATFCQCYKNHAFCCAVICNAARTSS